jgi:phage-related protein
MMARIIIFYGEYFIDFYKTLDNKVKEKVKYVLELIKQVERVPDKFLAPMTGYDGLFEIRIEYQSNIYRIFCCFDQGQLVVLFNGFQKKTQKTPIIEIERAMRIKREYFQIKINENDGIQGHKEF